LGPYSVPVARSDPFVRRLSSVYVTRKKSDWQTFNFPVSFKNQGDCVSYVNTINKPPKLVVPGQQRVEATGPSGAVVTFAVTAVDPMEGVISGDVHARLRLDVHAGPVGTASSAGCTISRLCAPRSDETRQGKRATKPRATPRVLATCGSELHDRRFLPTADFSIARQCQRGGHVA
jgi:hypothetical protein